MYHLFDQKHDESIAGHIQKSLSQSGAWLSIGFIFLLQFVNYGLENFKWRISYQEIKKESFLKTLKAVYAGNAIALFTPDRLGTFIGKTLLERMKADVKFGKCSSNGGAMVSIEWETKNLFSI